jgi:hypothetical protein
LKIDCLLFVGTHEFGRPMASSGLSSHVEEQ